MVCLEGRDSNNDDNNKQTMLLWIIKSELCKNNEVVIRTKIQLITIYELGMERWQEIGQNIRSQLRWKWLPLPLEFQQILFYPTEIQFTLQTLHCSNTWSMNKWMHQDMWSICSTICTRGVFKRVYSPYFLSITQDKQFICISNWIFIIR